MPEQPFNVHLFPVVRLEISVSATSHRAAIGKALKQTDLHTQVDGEYAGECSHFLAESADGESRWFYDKSNPLLANFARLVLWDERGRPEEALQTILSDVREILANSL